MRLLVLILVLPKHSSPIWKEIINVRNSKRNLPCLYLLSTFVPWSMRTRTICLVKQCSLQLITERNKLHVDFIICSHMYMADSKHKELFLHKLLMITCKGYLNTMAIYSLVPKFDAKSAFDATKEQGVTSMITVVNLFQNIIKAFLYVYFIIEHICKAKVHGRAQYCQSNAIFRTILYWSAKFYRTAN